MASIESVFVDSDKININNICLELTKWVTSKEDCESFFRNKHIIYFKEYMEKYDSEIKEKISKQNANETDEQNDIIVLCTIVNIPYQVRKYNQEKYIYWDISDLQETQSRLFLSGEICEQHENVKEGTVIALVNPGMKDKDPQYYNSRILIVQNKENIKLVGFIDKLEKCKGKKRNGENCKMILYTPLFGHYCKFHIRQDKSNKQKNKRKVNTLENYNDIDAHILLDTNENEQYNDEEGTEPDKKEKKKKKTDKKKKNTEMKGEEVLTTDVEIDKQILKDNEESFDVESIIGMYTNKIVVKDKKKKIELINNRIKELDDYSKSNNEPINEYTFKQNDQLNTKEDVSNVHKSVNDIISEQCPELIHLIHKSVRIDEKEKEIKEIKTEEFKIKQQELIEKQKEMLIINEEKQKKKFDNFLSKLIELKKSKKEEDVKTLITGLNHVTNNFSFHLKHIKDSNIVDICYKLMDHANEDVAIAALKFKRKINMLYIEYYKNKMKKQKLEHSQKDKKV
ncbi:Primase zinc finger containing protein, putative [Hepatocystis sp. ex Piliocolobus tephrosceles]|nr:Primase zinc finger containing protein, putative [Hepatocystis sp. ex Piliocolobus tephrosceles]